MHYLIKISLSLYISLARGKLTACPACVADTSDTFQILNPTTAKAPIVRSIFRANIRRRISIGYVLLIGLCAVGIQASEVVSSRLIAEPAQKRLDTAYLRLARFSKIQERFLENNRLLLTLISRPELVSNYGYHLSNNAKQLQSLLDDIAANVSILGEPDRTHTEVGIGLSQLEINRFVKWCQKVGTNYNAKLTPTLERAANASSTSQNAGDIQNRLIATLSSSAVVELETCALQLDNMIVDTQNELARANSDLASAKALETQITYLSLILSALVAIALALINSWAITRPLTKVSQIAQRISREEDFSLQIPVGR